MSLYKLLDPAGTGTPEIVADMKAAVDALTTAKTTASTDPVSAFSVLTTQSTNLTAALTASKDSPLIPWTLGTFKTLTNLVAAIDGIPTDVSTQITNATQKLSDAEGVMAKYLNTDTSTATSTTPKAVPAEITKAIQNADTIFGKATDATTAQKDEVCTNFNTLAVSAGIPLTSKPCGCSTTATDKNTCCAKKTTEADQDTCCDGAYSSTETTEKTTCKAVTLTPATSLNFQPDPVVNAVPAVSLPLDTSNTANSKDATMLGVIEFFQLADKSRR